MFQKEVDKMHNENLFINIKSRLKKKSNPGKDLISIQKSILKKIRNVH